MKLKNYTLLIGIGMTGNSNHIGTILSGLIQELNSEENNPIQFFQRYYILIKILKRIIGLVINY